VYIKHRLELGPHTAINAKLELHARSGDLAKEGLSHVARDVQARIEWSGKARAPSFALTSLVQRVHHAALQHAKGAHPATP
jgi:hypothetical protein